MKTLENLCDYHGYPGLKNPGRLLGVDYPAKLRHVHLYSTPGLGMTSVINLAVVLAQEVARLNSIIDAIKHRADSV